jgi:hypothetical protein
MSNDAVLEATRANFHDVVRLLFPAAAAVAKEHRGKLAGIKVKLLPLSIPFL